MLVNFWNCLHSNCWLTFEPFVYLLIDTVAAATAAVVDDDDEVTAVEVFAELHALMVTRGAP